MRRIGVFVLYIVSAAVIARLLGFTLTWQIMLWSVIMDFVFMGIHKLWPTKAVPTKV